jgi:hypothetical protein
MVGRLETPGEDELDAEGPSCERRGVMAYKDLYSVVVSRKP